ncbi:MAG: GAF domain-containing protein, partial [Myxococcales bacterium]|nr:GAF domain-containing protein [Myxococcales bacterium]
MGSATTDQAVDLRKEERRTIESEEPITDDLREEVRSLRALVLQQEAKIASILEISNALRATRTEEELLNLIMEKISLVMNADRSTLFLIDDDVNELWTKLTQNRRTTEVRLAIGEGIAGWVARSGQSINIKDAYKDPRFNPDIDNRTGYRTSSVLCQPMRNQERRIIGVIQVLNKKHGYFTVDDELLLAAIASQAAVVIENSALYHS